MKRICLVEDNKSLLNLTDIALKKEGYDVAAFNNAEKVLESIKKLKPDLILMDIMLPGLSGAEAVKELNKNNMTNVPVIFLTGIVSHEEDIEKTGIMVDGKVYRTLGKPYEIDQLLRLIKEVIK